MNSFVVHPMGYWLENTGTFLWASCIWCAPGIMHWFIENLDHVSGGSGDRTWKDLGFWWRQVGSRIRFLPLGLDLKYNVFGLLAKSMIVCVCSFSTMLWQSALQRIAKQGMLVTRCRIFISWFQSRICLMRLQKMRRLYFWFFLVTMDDTVRYKYFDPISRRRCSFDYRALP